MFGRKKGEVKEGDFVFTSRKDEGDYHNLIFGTVTGVDGNKIGVNGFFVNPVASETIAMIAVLVCFTLIAVTLAIKISP